jgi:hypothetical protein
VLDIVRYCSSNNFALESMDLKYNVYKLFKWKQRIKTKIQRFARYIGLEQSSSAWFLVFLKRAFLYLIGKDFCWIHFSAKKNSRKDCICLSKKRLLVKISNIRIKNGKPFLTKQCGKGLLWSAHAQFIHIGSRLLLDNTDYFDMQGVYVRWTWMYNTVMITYIQILIKNI